MNHFTNYRLWLWLGRFTGVAVVFDSVAKSEPNFSGFFACACAYGLAQYFRERPLCAQQPEPSTETSVNETET